MNLVLSRPVVFFDLETTGTDPVADRIVEYSCCRISPDCVEEWLTARVNPGIPIPAETSEIHGIFDADVAECGLFKDHAGRLLEFLGDYDLAGFNIKSFDIKFLVNEFRRAGIQGFSLVGGRNILDVYHLYKWKHPRTLEAAVRQYLGREHSGKHSAVSDVRATVDVLKEMVCQNDDIPGDVPGIIDLIRKPGEVDIEGRFVLGDGGQVKFTFGKYRGQPLASVARSDPGYLRWLLGQDFLDDVKVLVRAALGGVQ